MLKMNSSYMREMVVLLSVAVFGVGCTAPLAPSTELRVTRLESTESSLTATAERGNSRVTIVIQRNGPRVEGFVRDPEIDSPYESDVTIYNRHDFPFMRAFGGDVPGVGTSTDSTEPPAEMIQEQQVEDINLVIDTVAELQTRSDINERFSWELREVHNMAMHAHDHAYDLINGEVHPQPTPDVSEIEHEAIGPITVIQRADATSVRSSDSEGVAASVAYLSSTYTHVAYIMWKTCCWSFGHHSAVLVDSYYDSGTYIGYTSSSNHGTEASDGSMSIASGCPQSWSGRTGMFPYMQPYLVSDTYGTNDAGGCSTAYGLTSGYHVCNDDSQAEYWNVKYNAVSSWVTCGDSTLRTTEPSCN